MSIKSLYPDTRPSLNLDFANTKVLDPRITFARASTATYYDGKTVSKAEENLEYYSQQFNNWNIIDSTLTADTDIAPDGTQTADKIIPNTTNPRHIAYLGVGSITNNLPYTYSAYFKAAGYNFAQLGLYLNSGGADAYIIIDLTNGNVTQSAGNTGVRGSFTFSVQSVGNGWYRGVITCGNVTGMSTAQGMILAPSNSGTPSIAAAGSPTFSGNGTSGVLIWGAQMEQRSGVTAYTPTTNQQITRYQPTLLTATNNTPRFDHNPTTGESLGLLIEEQRTNTMLYSSDFTQQWSPLSSGSVRSNVTIAPDGNLTADEFVSGDANSILIQYAGGFSAGAVVTWSIYLKRSNTDWVYVRVSRGDPTLYGEFGSYFNLATGAVGSTAITGTATLVSKSITHVGNGWYRCIVVGNTTAATIYSPYITASSSDGGSTAAGLAVLCWGAQLEAGPIATSYIPTVASQVTRSADSASMTGTNFTSWYNNTQGALYIESQNDYNSSTVSAHAGTGVEIHSGAFQSNLFSFNSKRDGPYYGSPWFNIFTPGGGAGAIGNGVIGGGTNRISGSAFYKSSFSWNFGSTIATSADGTTTASGSLGLTSPPVVTTLGFATNYFAYNGFNGRIKKLVYYPKSLTNTQLQTLTQP